MPTATTLSADWTQVLARVEQALARAVVQIEAREKALAIGELAAPKAPDFGPLEAKTASLAEAPRRIAERLGQLDGELRHGEEALRQWLAQAETARRQLAAWVGRAVG